MQYVVACFTNRGQCLVRGGFLHLLLGLRPCLYRATDRAASALSHRCCVSVSHCVDAIINIRKFQTQDSLQMSEKSLFMVFLEYTDP